MIKVIGVNKHFNDKHILKDVTTTFYQGKVNLIIGQSGSGKTVLLKSIVGLHEVDEGQILYDDRDIQRLKPRKMKMLRREIGMLFQGSALFDSYTVEENVRFPLDIYTNMTKKEKENRVSFCLDHVNLSSAEKLLPGELSGGMQKRAAIARAIAMNPRYLFCDEPNSGLDPKTAVVIDELIMDLTKEFDMTTIVLTHDLNSMLGIGEHIVYVNEGSVGWVGNCQNLLETDNKKLRDFIYSSKILQH